MAGHLSVATVIEKNKVVSNVAFIILAQVHIVNPNTRLVEEVLYIARNNEAVTYKGNVYQPADFDLNIRNSRGQPMSVELSCKDPTKFIITKMDEMAGGVQSRITLMTINSARLNEEPEMLEEFEVLTANTNDFDISFSLGAANPLAIKFPKHRQMRDRCTWRFKGYGCQYTGAAAKCSYTLEGVDGCKAKSNQVNFGGLRGLTPLNLG